MIFLNLFYLLTVLYIYLRFDHVLPFPVFSCRAPSAKTLLPTASSSTLTSCVCVCVPQSLLRIAVHWSMGNLLVATALKNVLPSPTAALCRNSSGRKAGLSMRECRWAQKTLVLSTPPTLCLLHSFCRSVSCPRWALSAEHLTCSRDLSRIR